MKRLGIFGTAGMAREAADIAYEHGLEPVFVARDDGERRACQLPGDVMLESEVQDHAGMGYAIGIGDGGVRQRIAQRYAGTLNFVNLIHPLASFGRGQRQAIDARKGLIICAGVRFTSQIVVGDFCIFNLNATVSHDVWIDDFVYLAPGAHIAGNVQIGARAWIGMGAVVNQGQADDKRLIGADVVIGSGAVVTRDCESNAVYAGVPARKIR